MVDEPDAATRAALRALALASVQLVDEGRASEVPLLFAPGASLVIDGERFEGGDAVRGRYEARARQRHVVSRHAICNVQLRQPGPAQATGHALLIVCKGDQRDGGAFSTVVADLDDDYVLIEGLGWRIRERRLRTVLRVARVE